MPVICNYFHFAANVLPSPCNDTNLEGKRISKSKKYQGRGNKDAAVEACKKLQEKGFGTLLELGSSHGTLMVSNNSQFKKGTHILYIVNTNSCLSYIV